MSMRSAAAAPALPSWCVLDGDPAHRQLGPDTVGSRPVASSPRGNTLLEHEALRIAERLIALTVDERQDSKDVVDVLHERPQSVAAGRVDAVVVEQAVGIAHRSEDVSHRFGQVEVVVERGVEVSSGLGSQAREVATSAGGNRMVDTGCTAVGASLVDTVTKDRQAFDGSLRRLEGLGRVVEHLAVMRSRGEQVAHGGGQRAAVGLQDLLQGEEVAESLRHLLLVDLQECAVAPQPDELMTRRRIAPSDLVLVMGEDEIDRAAVDVDGLAEQREIHRRALEMPAGAASADAGVPARVTLPHRLPEGEVASVLLGVVVGVDATAGPGDQPGGADPAEPSVSGESRDPEVDAAVAAISHPRRLKAFDEPHHVLDVLGGPWIVVSTADAEGVDIGEKSLDPRSRLLVEAATVRHRVVDDPVIDVREVHHVCDPCEALLEHASEHVLEDESAEVTDVRPVPDRRTAGVEAHV